MADPSIPVFILDKIITVGAIMLTAYLTQRNGFAAARLSAENQLRLEEARKTDSLLEAAHTSALRAIELAEDLLTLEYYDLESGGRIVSEYVSKRFSEFHAAREIARQRSNNLRYILGESHPAVSAAADLIRIINDATDVAIRVDPEHREVATDQEIAASNEDMKSQLARLEGHFTAARSSVVPLAPAAHMLRTAPRGQYLPAKTTLGESPQDLGEQSTHDPDRGTPRR